MSTAKNVVKRLVLNRETIATLRVNSAVRAGQGATIAGQTTCPWPGQSEGCVVTNACGPQGGGDSGSIHKGPKSQILEP